MSTFTVYHFFHYLVSYVIARSVWHAFEQGTRIGSLAVCIVVFGCLALVVDGWRRRNHRDRYRDVLRSPRWRRLRRRAYDRSRGLCQGCHHPYPLSRLQLHHKHYSRLGRERLADVELLCCDCHAARHGKVA